MKTATFTKALTVSLRPEVFEKIKEITDEKKISIGEWVRDAVAAALTKNQQEEDQMND
jgi:metal-responsive CopG/Arc/MetJ family transcriptional regulator